MLLWMDSAFCEAQGFAGCPDEAGGTMGTWMGLVCVGKATEKNLRILLHAKHAVGWGRVIEF